MTLAAVFRYGTDKCEGHLTDERLEQVYTRQSKNNIAEFLHCSSVTDAVPFYKIVCRYSSEETLPGRLSRASLSFCSSARTRV